MAAASCPPVLNRCDRGGCGGDIFALAASICANMPGILSCQFSSAMLPVQDRPAACVNVQECTNAVSCFSTHNENTL